MLKVRVIPTLLWKDFGLVKGVVFDSWRRVGTVLPSVQVYNTRLVDELIIVDILASSLCSIPDVYEVQQFSSVCFVPLTIGGGIRNIEQIRSLLRSGADKVSMNTILYSNPEFASEASQQFGSQCIVASIDVRLLEDKWTCFSMSGAKCEDRDPVSWAKTLESLGVGEILLTSIDRDGTMKGYDLELVNAVSSAVSIPVIASGGAGTYQHMLEAVQAGANAVAAASMFHFTHQTPLEAKRFLLAHGVPTRI